MERNCGGVIWTNHALQRLRERGISQGDAWATWNRPEQSRKGSGSNMGHGFTIERGGTKKLRLLQNKTLIKNGL